MTIKRVVDKPSVKTAFPEFDSENIYIYKNSEGFIHQIQKTNKGSDSEFYTICLNSSGRNAFVAYDNRFKSFEEIFNYINNDVYIIPKTEKDLAKFILGCREFPKVKSPYISELNEDEVSIEDVNINSYIYASPTELGTHRNNGIELWVSANKGKVRATCFCNYEGIYDYSYNSDEFEISYIFRERLRRKTIYQFDNQEEFFRWALEQVTGKRFYDTTTDYIEIIDGEEIVVEAELFGKYDG